MLNENVVRYERLDRKDKDFKKKFDVQLKLSRKDVKQGKVICLSDLMCNGGM